jgi:hypothetical protein
VGTVAHRAAARFIAFRVHLTLIASRAGRYQSFVGVCVCFYGCRWAMCDDTMTFFMLDSALSGIHTINGGRRTITMSSTALLKDGMGLTGVFFFFFSFFFWCYARIWTATYLLTEALVTCTVLQCKTNGKRCLSTTTMTLFSALLEHVSPPVMFEKTDEQERWKCICAA